MRPIIPATSHPVLLALFLAATVAFMAGGVGLGIAAFWRDPQFSRQAKLFFTAFAVLLAYLIVRLIVREP